jgi:hypothetical protein
MAARTFVPTMYPLVDLKTGLVTSAWRRYQEGVSTAITPGASGEVYGSNGVAGIWAKIVNANIAVGAAILRSKLLFVANDLAWTILDKTGSSLADLATRSASDLATGTLALARGGTASNLSATGGASQVLRQSSAAAVVTVSQLASTDISGLVSDVYTPGLTNVLNLDASTAYQCQFLRVGSSVTVSGKVDMDPTAAASLTRLGLSLPIASNLGADEDCAGTICSQANPSLSGAIQSDAANNRAEVQFMSSTDVLNRSWYFIFMYRII